MATVKTSQYQLDSINRIEQPEYEREWAKGNAMEWFCENQGFFRGNVCYDFWLADSIYKRMIRLYPTSPLTDNAEWNRFNFTICHEGEDGSDHPRNTLSGSASLKNILRQS